MSYTFETAEPVTITGTGAKKKPNPFMDVVKDIAWKTNKSTGKAEARAFTEEHDADVTEKIRGRIGRMLSEAGLALETPGTVRRAFSDMKNDKGEIVGTRVTFWVVPIVKRPRKDEASAKAE